MLFFRVVVAINVVHANNNIAVIWISYIGNQSTLPRVPFDVAIGEKEVGAIEMAVFADVIEFRSVAIFGVRMVVENILVFFALGDHDLLR